MGRFSVVRWAFVVSCCLTWGCGVTRMMSRTASTQTDQTKAEGSEEETTKNPFQLGSRKSDVEETQLAEESSKSSKTKPSETDVVTNDAETQALIEEELRLAPPQEREYLAKLWKPLDPQILRVVLSQRRMTRRMMKQSPSRQTTGTADNFTELMGPYRQAAATHLDNVAGSGHSGDRRRTALRTGLGTSTPWNQNSPANSSQQASLRQGPRFEPSNQSGRNQFGPNRFGCPSDYRSPLNSASLAHAQNQIEAPIHRAGIAASNGAPPFDPSQRGRNRYQSAPYASQQPGVQYSSVPAAPVSFSNGGPQLATPFPAHRVNSNAPVNQLIPPGMTGNSESYRQIRHPTGPGNSLQMINEKFASPQFKLSSNTLNSKWGEELQRLIDLTESEASRMSPGTAENEQRLYVEKQAYLRMLYLMTGRRERAIEPIHGIEPAEQEFWQQVFWALASYLDDEAIPQINDRATQTIAQLKTAIQRLQEQAKLELRNVTFCHDIVSYGNYKRFERDEFNRGQPVLVYAEVDNFKSEPQSDGRFRTFLSSTIEIYKAGPSGELVEKPMTFPPTEDLCSNHRRDYFHSYEFTIPPRIGLGPHVMKLTVADQLGNKIATYSLNFTVK